ncbi:amidohydrolase family protein [Actinobacillus vicugnae]|uniref:amidohydrolase family protein n=1 Tax=Actinobacillus vicugnae TaxID=2573093 RepID=UPI00123F9ED2|nr:amidohydrolase family protein [Actinobacillus vicugnae]
MLSRRHFLLAGAISAVMPRLSFASESQKNRQNQPLALIAIEEHANDSALAQASGKAILANFPYLADWGKQVDDLGELDLTRPRVIKAKDSMQKLLDQGQGRLQEMNRHGITMQVLLHAAAPQFIQGESAVELIAKSNDGLMLTALQYPSRFAGFASLPWQDVTAAVKEAERCAKLGFKGVLINGRPSGDFLDHPRYRPILAKLNELNLPLFIHPGVPLPEVQQAYYGGFNNEVTARLSMFAWGWHNEAGIQVIRLILAGVLDEFPQLKLVSGHWGELVPYYLERLDDSIPQQATGLTRTIAQTYRDQVFVTNSGMTNLAHFNFVRETVGIDNMLFSVDYPYLSLNGARAWVENLPISAEDKAKFAYQNAVKLLGLTI